MLRIIRCGLRTFSRKRESLCGGGRRVGGGKELINRQYEHTPPLHFGGAKKKKNMMTKAKMVELERPNQQIRQF